MDKPRPGKTTFVIMVSPLPGKYELPACRPTATSDALHCTHTLTFLPASPSLLGPSTRRIHALSSKNSSILSHATGDHRVSAPDDGPAAPALGYLHTTRPVRDVTGTRASLQPTPRPSPRLPPPTPSGPAGPAGPLWGKRRPPPAPVLPPATCWDPAHSAACLTFVLPSPGLAVG